MVKESTAFIAEATQRKQETHAQSLEKEMATHSSILAGKPHEQRSLAGYIVNGVTKCHTQLSN